jgi:hypothetical protein
MFGNNHSIRRIATGIALAAVTAAVVAPAGFAAAGPQVGPPDPWELPYLHASQGQGGFVTDTTNSAQVARNAGTGILPAGFATDTLNSARVANSQLGSALPAGFATDTLNSARVAHNQPITITTVSGGFNWSSFGIGLGAGIGLLLALGVLAARTGRVRRLASA